MKKKVLVCVGTRPNLIKITQLEKYFSAFPEVEYILLHTGQHYDTQMNDVFFTELGIKKPDIQYTLESSSSQISVITEIMEKFESTCRELKPDIVVVPGDVNSSFSCAFVANRLGIPVAHIESGLRSFDNSMPEEINRILIDKLSCIHFLTEKSGIENLENEGYNKSSMKFVGNSMIDSLVAFEKNINGSSILESLNLGSESYVLFTFHRPINVDNENNLRKLVSLIRQIAEHTNVIFPIHPRTHKNLLHFNLDKEINESSNVHLTGPLGYLDFLNLIKNAKIVITDSGGVQEETTFLKIPCLTIRPNTERPITITEGTNKLLDFNIIKIMEHVNKITSGEYKHGTIPELWDGKASERIVIEIIRFLKNPSCAPSLVS